jgi:hypothetical protein
LEVLTGVEQGTKEVLAVVMVVVLSCGCGCGLVGFGGAVHVVLRVTPVRIDDLSVLLVTPVRIEALV